MIFDWNVMTVTEHAEIIAPTHFSGWDPRHPRHQRGAAGTGPKHGAGPWLQGASAEAIAAEAAKRGLASAGTEEEQRTAVEEALRAANKAWLNPDADAGPGPGLDTDPDPNLDANPSPLITLIPTLIRPGSRVCYKRRCGCSSST